MPSRTADARVTLCIGDRIGLQTLPICVEHSRYVRSADGSPQRMVGFVAAPAQEGTLKCEYVEPGQAPSRKHHCWFEITTPHQSFATQRREKYLATTGAVHGVATSLNDGGEHNESRESVGAMGWSDGEDRVLRPRLEQLEREGLIGDHSNDTSNVHSEKLWEDIADHIVKLKRAGPELHARWMHWKHIRRMHELEQQQSSEERHNAIDYRVRRGEPIVFGKIYQLLNVRFDQFLRVDEAIADEDDTSLKCSLVDRSDRSRMCWFRFKPGFATRHEGDEVRSGDTVVVESVGQEEMFIHCAGALDDFEEDDEAIDYGTFDDTREVNTSQRATPLKIVRVAPYDDCMESSRVQAGSIVKLCHRNSKRCLGWDQLGKAPCMHTRSSNDTSASSAKVAWQLERPGGDLSGANAAAEPTMVFNLKFPMTGQILCEAEHANSTAGDDRFCSLESYTDSVANHPRAQWRLTPFDRDSDGFKYNKTTFWLQNVGTDKVLTSIADTDNNVCTVTLDGIRNVEQDLFVFESFESAWLKEFLNVEGAISSIRNFKYAIDEAHNAREEDTPIAAVTRAADDLGITRERLHLAEFSECERWTAALNDKIAALKQKRLKPISGSNKDELQAELKQYVKPCLLADVLSTHLRQAGRRRPLDKSAGPVLVTLRRFLVGIRQTTRGEDDPSLVENTHSQLLAGDGLLNRQLQEMLNDFDTVDTLIEVLDSVLRAFAPLKDVGGTKSDHGFRLIEAEQFAETHGTELVETIRYCYRMLKLLLTGSSARNTRRLAGTMNGLFQGDLTRADDANQCILYPFLTPRSEPRDMLHPADIFNYRHQIAFKAADVVLQVLLAEVEHASCNRPRNYHYHGTVAAPFAGKELADRLLINEQMVEVIWGQVQSHRHPLYVDLINALLIQPAKDTDPSAESDALPFVENQHLVLNFLRSDWANHRVDKKGQPIFNKEVFKVSCKYCSPKESCAKHAREREFHVSLVRMVGLLCAGRHRESRTFFSEDDDEDEDDDHTDAENKSRSGLGFSYRLILQIIESSRENKYPFPARHAYAQLMLHLFVDRDQLEVCAPIQYTRIVVDTKQPEGTRNANGHRQMTLIADLKEAISQSLEDGIGSSGASVPTLILDEIENQYASEEKLRMVFNEHGLEPFIEAQLVRPTADDGTSTHAVIELRTEESLGQAVNRLPEGLKAHRYDPENSQHIQDIWFAGNAVAINGGQKDRNRFCAALIRLARQLVLCGCYSKTVNNGVMLLTDEGRKLASMMLMLLDGTTDSVSRAAQRSAQQQGIQRSCARYQMNEENRIVMAIKSEAMHVMKLLWQHERSMQLHSIVQLCTRPVDIDPRTDDCMSNNPLFSRSGATFEEESANRGAQILTFEQEAVKQQQEDGQAWHVGAVETAVESRMLENHRVFERSKDDLLAHILLDLLQYDDADLVFAAFDLVVTTNSQACNFYRALQSTTFINTATEVKMFNHVRDQVSRLSRLSAGLHHAAECTECIKVMAQLRTECSVMLLVPHLLRNLNICDILCRMLRLRLPNEDFGAVVEAALLLIGTFCEHNGKNQAVVASRVESIVFPLLFSPFKNEIGAACKCLCAVLHNNPGICAKFGKELINIVKRRSRGGSRHPGYLRILQTLVLTYSHSNDREMQMDVCVAMVSPSNQLWQTDGGKVQKNEWSCGPKVPRVKMIEILLLGHVPEDSEDYKRQFGQKATNQHYRADPETTLKRCQDEAAYYSTSMEVLGDCCAGDSPQAALLCSHRLSFVKVIKRLHELYTHKQCCEKYTKTRLDKTRIKYATMHFFRTVYVQTSQMYMRRYLRSPENGLWTLHESDSATGGCKALGDCLVDDLQLLNSEIDWDDTTEETCFGGEFEAMSDEQKQVVQDKVHMRRYLFRQVVQFFINFAQAHPLGVFPRSEAGAIEKVYVAVLQEVETALRRPVAWQDSEIQMLEGLHRIGTSYVSSLAHGDELQWMCINQHDRSKSDGPEKDLPVRYAKQQHAWQTEATAAPNGNASVSSLVQGDILEWMRIKKWDRSKSDGPYYDPASFQATIGTVDLSSTLFQHQDGSTDGVAISEFSGSRQELGIGVMRVAAVLRTPVPTQRSSRRLTDRMAETSEHYSSFICKALAAKLDSSVRTHERDLSSLEDIDTIRTILDTVRAMLYVETVYTEEQMEGGFRSYLKFEPITVTKNPNLASVQSGLIAEGWGLLCFRLLSHKRFAALHLTALQVLEVLVSDAQTSVKDDLLSQLENRAHCPQELCASSFRRLLRAHSATRTTFKETNVNIATVSRSKRLSLMQKALHLTDREEGRHTREKQQSNTPASVSSDYLGETPSDQVATYMLASVILRCIRKMAAAHRGMQVYLEQQPGHEQSLSIISDVVDHLTTLENDVVLAIAAHADPNSTSTRLHQADIALGLTKAGIDTLIALAQGPNQENQLTIAVSNVLPVLSRLLGECDYVIRRNRRQGRREKKKHTVNIRFGSTVPLDNNSRDHHTDRCYAFDLARQIAHLLKTLLDGTPQAEIVSMITSSVSWTVVHRHLQDLRDLVMHSDIKYQNHTRDLLLVKRRRVVKKLLCTLTIVVQKCADGLVESDGNEINDGSRSLRRLLQDHIYDFALRRVGVAEVVRQNQLEKLFFIYPDVLLYSNVTKEELESSMIRAMDKIVFSDTDNKLRAFISVAMENVAMVDQKRHVAQADGVVKLANKVRSLLPGEDALFLSMLIVGLLLVSYDHTSDTRSSHNIDTYGRVNYPHRYVVYAAFFVLGMVHLVACCLSFLFFVSVRVPVLREMQMRESRLELSATWRNTDTERHNFAKRSVQLYGIPNDFIVPDATGNIERPNIRAIEQKLKRAVAQHKELKSIATVRFNYVPGDANSWAIVTFATDKGYLPGRIHPAIEHLQAHATTKHVGMRAQSFLQLSLKKTSKIMKAPHYAGINFLDLNELQSSDELEKALEEAWIDVVQNEKLSTGHQYALGFLGKLHKFFLQVFGPTLGAKIPIQEVYHLRNSFEFWLGIADIVFSVLGYFYSPLAFSFHLTHLSRLESAAIVMKSIWGNWRRLGNTLVLALMFIFMFAVAGLLRFRNSHTVGPTEISANIDGPCASLLSCFTSYTYAGLMQTGIGGYLDPPTFPEHTRELLTHEFQRLTWETGFMLVTSSLLMSVLTGIICDSFGDLRMQADKAKMYRTSTCFVTGIPYSRVPKERGTDYMDYVALILYLHSLRLHSFHRTTGWTPIEKMVADQIDRGEISWLPDGRCMSLEQAEEQGKVLKRELNGIRNEMLDVQATIKQILDERVDQGTKDP